MKRDLNLARQLLLDIEARGADCSVSVLRPGANHDHEEQIRYHLRLLIDANLLKEVDRTSAGIPCVRLTHEGHELLELARSENRWREAELVCQERIGGLSLTVIRGILLRWATQSVRGPVLRRHYTPRRLRYEPELYVDPAYRIEPYESIEDGYLREGDNVRYVRVRSNGEYSANGDSRYGIDLDGDGRVDVEYNPDLPGYLI